MINQFRLLYPQGSIVSELITIEGEKYVVRVLIQLDDKILATGLAAAETVEQAEDRALDRALSLLSFPENVVSPQSQVAVVPQIEIFEPKKEPKSSPPNLSLVPPPLLAPLESPLNHKTEREKPVNISQPSQDNTDASNDFVADTIAEITIQMQRLGWTKEDGRDYLLRTYGKKSRHLLSDEELLEFLSYLKTQTDG